MDKCAPWHSCWISNSRIQTGKNNKLYTKINLMKDQSKVLLALLTGLAAGAAMGILFAPEKGTHTRDKLSDALNSLGDNIRDRAADEIGDLTSFTDKIIGSFKSKLKSAEDDYTKTAAAAKDLAHDAKTEINKATNY